MNQFLPMQRHPNMLGGLIELCHVLRKTSPCESMAEIGVFFGEATVFFATIFNKVYAVDPFIGGYDPRDGSSAYDFQAVEQNFRWYTRPIHNIELLKYKSMDAAEFIVDGTLDFVYIDALHTYEGVRSDIEIWLPKIKPGGYIGGHDYGFKQFPGVAQAVREQFGQPDIIFPDFSWLKGL